MQAFGEISYYQVKTGNEIDFILNKNRAFEVKEAAFDNDLRNLKNLAKNINIDPYFVIGRRPNTVLIGFYGVVLFNNSINFTIVS